MVEDVVFNSLAKVLNVKLFSCLNFFKLLPIVILFSVVFSL